MLPPNNMLFSPAPPTIMHVDLNSCFATVEQQANPLLRGRPLVVAAYTTGNGCILAASVEAKILGVKTGMPVREGLKLCPGLIVLPSDPDKYRFINRKLCRLLGDYTPYFSVESIDEIVLDLRCHIEKLLNFPQNIDEVLTPDTTISLMLRVGREIKLRIKKEIGEWLTVSVGIAPNRYLAKVASGLRKPDGLDVINRENIEHVFAGMSLTDLCGIKIGYATRLAMAGIKNPPELLAASAGQLKAAFRSVVGWQWWSRLHGWETDPDFTDKPAKTLGHSYALGKPYRPQEPAFLQIVHQLIAKLGRRLRAGDFTAYGAEIYCAFTDHSHWRGGGKTRTQLLTDRDFTNYICKELDQAPAKPVRLVAVTSYDLALHDKQLPLLSGIRRDQALTQALDAIADRWGGQTVIPGRLLGMEHKVLDRIAFGKAN